MRKKRKPIEIFSLSFLDVVSCGFGAIILLLVISKISQPVINKENTIGGISVNSEYIIFIIDTSGSMHNFAWPLVQKKMQEILKVHPSVKGIQVMNDMGDYMFSQYAGRWIPDSPGRRRAILKRLKSWEPFSNFSLEEGITKAIRTFYDANKQIALYIFGDDFSRGSIQSVIDTVSRLNRSHRKGSKHVRINAVGFPVLFQYPGTEMNIARFSALMRKLAEENNGSFVGLNSLK